MYTKRPLFFTYKTPMRLSYEPTLTTVVISQVSSRVSEQSQWSLVLCSDNKVCYLKSEITKALFTLPATQSHPFLMRAGDIQWHKWQRQDKVEKSWTSCKWAVTLGIDYQWKWVHMFRRLCDNAVQCRHVAEVNPIR